MPQILDIQLIKNWSHLVVQYQIAKTQFGLRQNQKFLHTMCKIYFMAKLTKVKFINISQPKQRYEYNFLKYSRSLSNAVPRAENITA